MWIRKRDSRLKKGVESPMPTQVVSNEEFNPRPQNEKQKQVEHLIGEMGEERAKKLGHASPRLHAHLDGVGHGLPGDEPGLRQLLGGG